MFLFMTTKSKTTSDIYYSATFVTEKQYLNLKLQTFLVSLLD